MRAIQFAARFEFHIDNETMRMMKNHSAGIKEIKGERILDELKKITGKGGNIQFALELLTESGLDSMLLGGILSEEVVKSWDDLSFFYVLSNAASPNPDRFYRERLKGDREMAKELEVLHRLIKMDVDSIDEEELRYQTFLAFKRAPSVSRADILPYKIHGVFSKMKGGLIPSKDSDIDLDGKEIEEILNINGPEIGMIKEMVHRGSLMNRVDWKDKKALIKFIRSYGKTSFL
jgi:tRNA nucleotidyltransferase/poly(A) polymerase